MKFVASLFPVPIVSPVRLQPLSLLAKESAQSISARLYVMGPA